MFLSSRMRLLSAAVAALATAAAACSAIVGVEDVNLARSKDSGGGRMDDEDGDIIGEDGEVFDAQNLPEASVQLAVGYIHTCARKNDGKVRCWGDNGSGQIGDGISFDAGTRDPVLKPQEVVNITDAISLASGVNHSCAIKRNGSVVCWGSNLFGQLGDGTTDKSSTPVTAVGVNNAIAIACGTSFSCALINGGTVSCWGANYAGQLGDGTKVDRGNAMPVMQLTGAVAVAAAERHACAIVGGGTVKCWGENDDGQLGTGNTTESLTPVPLPSLTDVVQIAAAAKFTCSRQRSGQVNCWGANDLGQLGTGSQNNAPNPAPAITAVSDAIAIWVGYDHACAVRRSGAVACWGSAGFGQVGSGLVPGDASIPQPTAVMGVSGALGVSTGGDHSCATTANGAVFCWGANSLGQLGNGTTEPAYIGVAVTGFP